jgi:hypothetical protein
MRTRQSVSWLGSIWKNIGYKFPYAPRIRRSFIGLIGFCILAILVTQQHEFIISVVPNPAFTALQNIADSYNGNLLLPGGRLAIKDPGLFQHLFLNNTESGTNLFTLIMIMIGSAIIAFMMPKMTNQLLFRKDVSVYIKVLGVLIIVHALVTMFYTLEIRSYVKELTNGQFTTPGQFPVLLFAEMYIGWVVMAVGTWYKKGVKLQREQDLTI